MNAVPDFTIYRSSHVDVLAAYENHKVEYKDWCERWTAQIAAWGFDKEENKPYVTDGVWGAAQVIGVYWGYRRDPLPAGWKRVDSSRNRQVLEPYRSKAKAVPQIQSEFKALVKVPDIRRDLVALGMPHHMFTGLAVTTYAFRALDSEVWVKWRGTDPLASDQWWSKVKLSDYYVMTEGGSDPFAAEDDAADGAT